MYGSSVFQNFCLGRQQVYRGKKMPSLYIKWGWRWKSYVIQMPNIWNWKGYITFKIIVKILNIWVRTISWVGFLVVIKKPVRAQNYRHLHFTLTMILKISNIYDIYEKNKNKYRWSTLQGETTHRQNKLWQFIATEEPYIANLIFLKDKIVFVIWTPCYICIILYLYNIYFYAYHNISYKLP
jgi:hypothetical protein